MFNKELNIEECHKRLLDISKLFHQICITNKIPYYLIGGTLLGAIRHKGFIPWDDDMDFGVPFDYYDRLIMLLRTHLPTQYDVVNFQTKTNCFTIYYKIEDLETCIDDKCVSLPINEKMGINVDVFPLNYCSIKNPKLKRLKLLQNWNRRIYTESTSGEKHKHYAKKLLQMISPLSQRDFLNRIHEITMSINDGNMMANLFSPYGFKEFMPIEYFGEPVLYQFEDTSFFGPCKPHNYLTQLYGDYMTLPPITKRNRHADKIYLRK
jgi:lipopolysaccharide cholinephosphotransferase